LKPLIYNDFGTFSFYYLKAQKSNP